MAIDLYAVPPAPDHIRDAYRREQLQTDLRALCIGGIQRLFYAWPEFFGEALDVSTAQGRSLDDAPIALSEHLVLNPHVLKFVLFLGTFLSVDVIDAMPEAELRLNALRILRLTIDEHGFDALVRFIRPLVAPYSVTLRACGA